MNIAGIDDPGIAADFLGGVDMAQRPIIIAKAFEVLDAAGSVGFMSARTVERGVQQADIEPAFAPRRIGRDEVRIDQPLRKAPTVQRDAQGLDLEGTRVARGKNPRALGIGQRPRHQAFGVVIALDDEGGDSRALQTAQLAGEKQAGRHVLPIAVENIAANQQESGLRGDGLVDQRLDRSPPRPREASRDGGVLAAKAGERTVDMEIGGVKEGELHEKDGSGARDAFDVTTYWSRRGYAIRGPKPRRDGASSPIHAFVNKVADGAAGGFWRAGV